MTSNASPPIAGTEVLVPEYATDRLSQLFAGLYGRADSPVFAGADADLAGFLATADPGEGNLTEAFEQAVPQARLLPRQRGILDVAPRVLADFFSQPAFHPELGRALLGASGNLVRAALPEDGWLLRKRHPAGELLALVAEVAQGWDPSHPRAGEFRATLEDWLRGGAGDESPEQTLERARTWLEQFRQRRERVLERVREAESGTLKLRYARQLAARSLNRLVAGRKLPDFMAESLEGEWMTAFQWVLLHEGEDSALWQQLNRSFGLLIWTLQPEAAAPAQREKLGKVVERVRQELGGVLARTIGDRQAREQLLEAVQIAQYCQLNGRPLEYVDAPVVEGGGALDDAGVGISRDILDEVEAVSPGEWFLVTETGQRVQLLLREDRYRQLLFVTQPGMKAFALSFEEFAWQFTSAEISAVPRPLALAEWVGERLASLAADYRKQKRAWRQEQQRREREQAEQAAVRASREKARKEARQAADQARAQTAEKPAQEAAGQQSGQGASAGPDAERSLEQLRQRARLLVSGMTMGTWLVFRDKAGGTGNRRLAVVLPSSGKYIFVDGTGMEKHQVTREELIEGLVEGTTWPLQQDGRFDDALTRVVDGQRRGFA